MGCCTSTTTTQGIRGTESGGAPPQSMSQQSQLTGSEIRLSEYTDEDFESEIDFEVVCITKPELSYVIKVEKSQLSQLTLRDLETQIIEDMAGYMIESFRLLHSTHVEKSFYNEKLIRFMDLLPIYIELSVDETIAHIQVEIPQSQHVINIPYEPTTTLRHIKKRVARYSALNSHDFELMHDGEIILLDDMSLNECQIYPMSKIFVVDPNMPESEIATAPFTRQSILDPFSHLQQQQLDQYQLPPNCEPPKFIGQVSNTNLQLEDFELANITKVMTKINEEEQTLEENCRIITSNPELEATTHPLMKSSEIEKEINQIHSQENDPDDEATRVRNSDDIAPININLLSISHHKPGLNIQIECESLQCKLAQKRCLFHIGFGELFLKAAETQQVYVIACKECSGSVKMFAFNFFECSYLVSGIYTLKAKTTQPEEIKQQHQQQQQQQKQKSQAKQKQLKKFHNGQWGHTIGKQIETINMDQSNRNWKQIRIRTCPEKTSKKETAKCSLCTQLIYSSRELKKQLSCGHVFHAACFKKLQTLNSPCVMCVF